MANKRYQLEYLIQKARKANIAYFLCRAEGEALEIWFDNPIETEQVETYETIALSFGPGHFRRFGNNNIAEKSRNHTLMAGSILGYIEAGFFIFPLYVTKSCKLKSWLVENDGCVGYGSPIACLSTTDVKI